ncbi:protein kinase [Colletotrichum lupini]|uniref:Protein kinase n=1 Tax=Colletotrichum lupini TaxID=145971 RepID=A0A9Q8T2A9_9PEZI|nr:protein kinase [Colletotrichum lupini]UQC87904.1 protein kinase [Colletotrichum lupini]
MPPEYHPNIPSGPSPNRHPRTLSEDLSYLHLGGSIPKVVIGDEHNPALDAIHGNQGLDNVPKERPAAPSEQTSVGNRNPPIRSTDQAQSPPSAYTGVPLDELLRSHYQPHPHPEVTEGYLPTGLLEELVGPEAVKQELTEALDDDSDINRIAQRVCESSPGSRCYRQVFAILCLIERVRSIREFLDPVTGVCDSDLPLQKVELGQRNKVDLRKRKDLDKPLGCFQGWRHNSLRSFDDWQWTLRVPFLKGIQGSEAQYRKFDDRVILPLTYQSDPNDDGATGGFSEVFKVKLHPRHHDFSQNGADCFFALKRLRSTDTAAFQRELQMLRKFESENAHEHLISLLTTWSQKGFFYFLFPWAECDLVKYWEIHSEPDMGEDLVRWVARQTAGMAAGLARIHEYPGKVDGNTENAVKYGRHGDIKPDNILWFRSSMGDPGRLVISDFGLGVFNSKRSRSNIPNNSGIGRTPTYRPPECDIEGAMISRSWDIWTLGCVYVEFVTWLLGGWELSEDFAEYRMTRSSIWGQEFKSDIYFDIVQVVRIASDDDTSLRSMGAMVKPNVTRWFDGLHNHRDCTQYTHDLLKFVQNRMLIVESAVRKRATCKEVFEELRRIQRRCVESKAYCVEPKKPSEASHSSRPHRRAAKGEGGTWGSTSTTSNRESILSDYENHRPEDRSEILEQG